MNEKFVRLDYDILHDDNLNLSEKIIYSYLKKFKCMEYGYCFKSNSGISEELNISASTVKRTILKLKKNNYILIKGSSSKRQIFILDRGQIDPTQAPNNSCSQGQNDPPERSKWTSEKVKLTHPKGQNDPHNRELNRELNREFNREYKEKKIYKKNPLVIFNDVFDTNYRNATKETIKIGTDFTEEEIYLVCQKARDDNFWRDKATPYNIFKLSNFEKLLNTEKEKTTKDIANQIDIFEGW